VIVTGYVADAEPIWLYRNCYANLYPCFRVSGLPVLEGMQFGAPIASHQFRPEVAGGGAAAARGYPPDGASWRPIP
jgi:glycosyltransferase involved in cell wall biosynthesis